MELRFVYRPCTFSYRSYSAWLPRKTMTQPFRFSTCAQIARHPIGSFFVTKCVFEFIHSSSLTRSKTPPRRSSTNFLSFLTTPSGTRPFLIRFDTQGQRQCWQKRAPLAKMPLKQLQEVARLGGNVFEELMETVKVASLGQITDALFNVGGQNRRSMGDQQLH